MIKHTTYGVAPVFWVAVILSALLFVSPFLWASDHALAFKLRKEGKILPLEEIIKRARLHPDEHIIEVELEEEHGTLVYELEFIGRDGVVRERLYDASSGKLIKESLEDD